MKPRIHFDESPTFGRSAQSAKMQIAALGLAGHGDTKHAALIALEQQVLFYQRGIELALEAIAEAIKDARS
jgi:hypothetical protein